MVVSLSGKAALDRGKAIHRTREAWRSPACGRCGPSTTRASVVERETAVARGQVAVVARRTLTDGSVSSLQRRMEMLRLASA